MATPRPSDRALPVCDAAGCVGTFNVGQHAQQLKEERRGEMGATIRWVPVGVELHQVCAHEVEASRAVDKVTNLSCRQTERLGPCRAHHHAAVQTIDIQRQIGSSAPDDFSALITDVVAPFFVHLIRGNHRHAYVVGELP